MDMWKLVSLLLVGALPLTVACDQDCDRPERLDGSYLMRSNAVEHLPPADEIPEAYPVEDVFYNGLSDWNLKYVPRSRTFNVDIDGRRYTASYQQNEDNCNAFTMDIEGLWVAADGSQHNFGWTGNLVYFGSKVAGEFTYEASWSNTRDGASGVVEVEGEVFGESGGSSDADVEDT